MNSYEIVRRAIEFDYPERLPLRFEALGLSDVLEAPLNQVKHGDLSLPSAVDEWGCVWSRTAMKNMGQVKVHPLQDWSSREHYRFPDPHDPGLYAEMAERLAGGQGKYRLASIFMLLFERMHALHGFENTLIDLQLDHPHIHWLADQVVAYDLAVIENLALRFPGRIHGLWFTDDWGTQQNTIISPALWREFFKPRYRLIFEAAHQHGWHIWMHSCGKINRILGDLIEIGLNVVNLQQPRALGIEEVGERFRGQVCFETLCDIQSTLPASSEAEIREEARRLLAHWAAPSGGFILSDYGDGFAIGVEESRKQVMLQVFREADPFAAQSSKRSDSNRP